MSKLGKTAIDVASVYRKPTHTEQCLKFYSNSKHSLSTKKGIMKTLTYRVETICSTQKVLVFRNTKQSTTESVSREHHYQNYRGVSRSENISRKRSMIPPYSEEFSEKFVTNISTGQSLNQPKFYGAFQQRRNRIKELLLPRTLRMQRSSCGRDQVYESRSTKQQPKNKSGMANHTWIEHQYRIRTSTRFDICVYSRGYTSENAHRRSG